MPAFYPNMSARRNLRLIGSAGGHVTEERVSEVLDTVGLLARGDTKVGGYSHGMKQRLGIANALLDQPEVIILDEPTSGLDPQGMKDVRELVRELGSGGHHRLFELAPAARGRAGLQPGGDHQPGTHRRSRGRSRPCARARRRSR